MPINMDQLKAGLKKHKTSCWDEKHLPIDPLDGDFGLYRPSIFSVARKKLKEAQQALLKVKKTNKKKS